MSVNYLVFSVVFALQTLVGVLQRFPHIGSHAGWIAYELAAGFTYVRITPHHIPLPLQVSAENLHTNKQPRSSPHTQLHLGPRPGLTFTQRIGVQRGRHQSFQLFFFSSRGASDLTYPGTRFSTVFLYGNLASMKGDLRPLCCKLAVQRESHLISSGRAVLDRRSNNPTAGAGSGQTTPRRLVRGGGYPFSNDGRPKSRRAGGATSISPPVSPIRLRTPLEPGRIAVSVLATPISPESFAKGGV